jgi:hypothetical protein
MEAEIFRLGNETKPPGSGSGEVEDAYVKVLGKMG